MTFSFIHAADVHLGYTQYGSRERFWDFSRAFSYLVNDALTRRVDFVLLAGDLFHKRSIDPETLLHAAVGLEKLRDEGILAIAIEGNHEHQHSTDQLSWLDYLAEMGFLILLAPAHDQNIMTLHPWDVDQKRGGYIDLPCGARIIGIKYYGGATKRVVADLPAAIEQISGPRPLFTIAMMHAGVQGILDDDSATLPRSLLDPLRPMVDYVALGHIHKPYSQDDWVYNPGSLETNSVTECAWNDRGYYVVQVDNHRSPPTFHTERVINPRRAFERLAFLVDAYETPAELHTALEAYLRSQATPKRVAAKPVVELQITGLLPFEHTELELDAIGRLLDEIWQPLLSRVRDGTGRSAFEILMHENLNRDELERHVISELLSNDIRLRPNSALWADAVLRIKRMALSGSAPEAILRELRILHDTSQNSGAEQNQAGESIGVKCEEGDSC